MAKDQTKDMTIYRIINPNNRVIDLKDIKSEADAYRWLQRTQAVRKDPFLEVQTKVGRSWVTLESPPPSKSHNSKLN